MIALRNLVKDAYRSMLEPYYAISTFRKRLGCYLNYRFKIPKNAPPENITFFLTHKCNLRCKMCGQVSHAKREEELSGAQLKKVIDEISLFKPNVILYGGEPLLYKDIAFFVAYLMSKGVHVCIITNGTLLNEYAGLIVKSGVDVISVSIDGPLKIHDEIRGQAGTFEKIAAGTERINEKKKELKRKKPLLNIVFTISSFNYLYMEDMPGIAKDLGAATLNFHHLIFMDKETAKRQNALYGCTFGQIASDWEGFIQNEAGKLDADTLIKKINNLKRMKTDFLINFYPNFTDKEIRQYYSTPEFSSKGYSKRCLSPWISAYIYPDGSVKPCLAVDYKAGNIKDENFLDIWSGDKFNKFRDALKKEKCFLVCAKCTELYRY